MRFWDSSALVPLCVGESTTPSIQQAYRRDPELLVWMLTDVEISSALCRRRREARLSTDDFARAEKRLNSLQASWHEVTQAPLVRARARRLLRSHQLRGADALQLGAALVALRDDVDGIEFMTLDHRLRDAAAAEGFATPLDIVG